jgi:hypothetical protein
MNVSICDIVTRIFMIYIRPMISYFLLYMCICFYGLILCALTNKISIP